MRNFPLPYLWCHRYEKKKKKKAKKIVHSSNDDWSWQISLSLCWKFRKWFVLYFNFLSLIVTYSGQFTWQGHRKFQWAMSKDELLLSNCPLKTAEPSRNYARVPGYKKGQEKDKKRKEKNQPRRNPYALVGRYKITSHFRTLGSKEVKKHHFYINSRTQQRQKRKKNLVSTVALEHVCVRVWRTPRHVRQCMCACICQKNVYVKEKMCMHAAERSWQLSRERQMCTITSTLRLLLRGDPQDESRQGWQPRACLSKLDYFHAGITSKRLHRIRLTLYCSAPVFDRILKKF